MAKAQKAREPGAKPSIFLSHSSADAAWCRSFFEALQQKGFDIWYHEDQQSESAAQRQTANEQVRTRDVFLVVLSPDSYNAPHVQDEILLALASQRFILSVIIGDIPTLGLLTAEMHIDVRGQTLNDAAMTTDIYIEGHEGSWWYRGPQHAGAVNPMRVPARVPEAFSSLWEPGEA